MVRRDHSVSHRDGVRIRATLVATILTALIVALPAPTLAAVTYRQLIIAPPAPTGAAVPYTKQAQLTFYGWPDNDPAHSAGIAFPGCKGTPTVCHDQAGGTGTWTNPLAAAAPDGSITTGARIYLAYLHKYVIIEDTCAGCTGVWLDIWVDGAGAPDQQVIDCESAATPAAKVSATFHPPSTLGVDKRPIFNVATERCAFG